MGKTKILDCKNLYKKIGKKQILEDVSLYVEEGDILGFIGPNGAGKTTAIKLMLGLQKITSGEVYINGYNLKKDFAKAMEKVGAIVENPDSYMYLTGRQNLELIQRLYKGVTKEKINEIIKLVKLENRIDDKVSKYSLGMRQRLGIAKALIHDPNLLILDEPTNGLDPEGMKELRDILRTLAREKNISILISSHNLAEIETLCNKISIIQNGKIVESNTIDKIKTSDEGYKYILEFVKNVEETQVLEKISNLLDEEDSKIEKISNNKISIHINQEDLNKVFREIVQNKIEIVQIYKDKVSLEDAFIKKVGGNKIA